MLLALRSLFPSSSAGPSGPPATITLEGVAVLELAAAGVAVLELTAEGIAGLELAAGATVILKEPLQ